eukprot:11872701-Ditylum_brightwellii.AAC.2
MVLVPLAHWAESSDNPSSTGGADPRSGYISDNAVRGTDSYEKEEDTSSSEEESDGQEEAAESTERKEKKGSKTSTETTFQ